MNNESLKLEKIYLKCDDNVILDILKTEMRKLDLTAEINNQCEKQESIGSVYPILSRLERQKYISSRYFQPIDGSRKYRLFKATRDGGLHVYEAGSAKEMQDMRGNFSLAYHKII